MTSGAGLLISSGFPWVLDVMWWKLEVCGVEGHVDLTLKWQLTAAEKEAHESLTAMIWLAQRGCGKMWLVSVKEWPPSISWVSWKRDKGNERENLQHEDILPDWTYNVYVLFCFHTVCVVHLCDCLSFSCSGLSYKGHKEWESLGIWFPFNRLWCDIKQLSMHQKLSRENLNASKYWSPPPPILRAAVV